MSTSNKKVLRPTAPPPPPPPPPKPRRTPHISHVPPAHVPPRNSNPKNLTKALTETDLLSFLSPFKKASKTPTTAPAPTPAPRNATKNAPSKKDLVNLLFPPRNKPVAVTAATGSTRTTSVTFAAPPPPPRPASYNENSSRVRHSPSTRQNNNPHPQRSLPAKPPLSSDLYSFFFHPRNRTAKIVNQRPSRSSMQVDPSPRAVQLSSFGNSRSCSNLNFDDEWNRNDDRDQARNNFNTNLFNPRTRPRHDVWRLPPPIQPVRTNDLASIGFIDDPNPNPLPSAPPASEILDNSRPTLKGILKRSVSSGSLNLNRSTRTSETEDNYSECTICCEKGVDSVFIPCGHMCMCFSCADEYWNSQTNRVCPICRAPCSGVFRTFASS